METFNAIKYADENRVPYTINLRDRYGACTARLRLVGMCVDELNYEVISELPYTVHHSTEPDVYEAIDFSGGPMISPGVRVHGMLVSGIHSSVDNKMLIIFTNPNFEK